MDLEGHLHKGLPPVDGPLALEDAAGCGWNALGGDLPFPVLVLRDADLRHNQATMSAFCAEHGASLAPHGKTTMSRQLIRRQLDAGVWAMTAANPTQARAMRAFGAPRILIANQVIDPVGLRWMAAETATGEAWISCLVDSVRGVELMEKALATSPAGVRLPVLVELGEPGHRAGCRTQEAAMEVAAAVAGAPHLRLVGVEVFEGVLGHDADARTLATVDAFLTRLRDLALALARRGDFRGLDEILVTAGGSLYFDRVAAVLGKTWPLEQPVRLVLRGGCYLTHDHGNYQRVGPLGHRAGGPELRPAMEIWALVQSVPEPGLALLGFGKRDVSYDEGLPVPLRIRSHDGTVRDADGFTVTRLNDQHGYLAVPSGDGLQVGDLVCCGLLHPCTVFDKWRVIPIVDEGYRVLEVVETAF
ncbi:MAG: alanine racemase [Candidatus Dormibacteraeota bacterium]|nr:alanine racemase [Candidatus Dormibacteraeota bacterium]